MLLVVISEQALLMSCILHMCMILISNVSSEEEESDDACSGLFSLFTTDTLLMHAVRTGKEECAIQTLEESGLSELTRNNKPKGATPMHLAVEKRMSKFLDKAKDYDPPIVKDDEGNTPLHYLVNSLETGNALNELSNFFEDPYFKNQMFEKNNKQETPLDRALCHSDSEHFISMCNMYAVMQGNTEFFKQTHYLALCDKCEFVIGLCHDEAHRANEAKKCMTNPPSANETLQGVSACSGLFSLFTTDTLLMHAVRTGNEECAIQTLDESGLSELTRKNKPRGATPIHLAVEKRMSKFLKKAKDYDPPIVKDDEGNTPLHYLVNSLGIGNALNELSNFLKDPYFKKQMFEKNNKQETPLDTALCHSDSEHFISMCNMYAVMQGNTEFFKQTHYLALCDKCEFVIGLCHDKAHRADEAEKCMTNPPTADEKLQKKLDELEGIIGHIHGRELLDLEKKQ